MANDLSGLNNLGNLRDALTLKSTLQQLSNRENATEDHLPEADTKRVLTLREAAETTELVKGLPRREPVQVEMSRLPTDRQVVMIQDTKGNPVYSRMVIPANTHEAPYLQQLTQKETESLKGTRSTVEVIKAAGMITAGPVTGDRKLRLPVFLEPGERLFFSIYNRILHLGRWEQSTNAYITELILILCFALGGILYMWFQAVSGSSALAR